MMIIDTRFFKIQELIHREDPAQNDRSFNQDGKETSRSLLIFRKTCVDQRTDLSDKNKFALINVQLDGGAVKVLALLSQT